MSILNVKNVSHSFAGRDILKDVSFRLLKGEHVALIGANGEGKSTFLNIITGKLAPEEGSVSWCNRITFGYLDQHSQMDPTFSIKQVLQTAFDHLFTLEQEMMSKYDQMADCDEETMNKLLEDVGEISEILEHNGFYMIDTKINEIASGLGLLDLGLDTCVNNLSGGQRTKVLLAKLLLENPMVLILDEPTNYLDEGHINWLVNFLTNYENAFILVSHEIEFLNKVVNVIYHVENGELTRYVGNYDNFVAQHEIKIRQQEIAYKKQQAQISELEDFIARNKARVATRNMAHSRQKQLDKMTLLEKPKTKIKPTFGFIEANTLQRYVIEANQLVIGYDSPLCHPLDLVIERNKKIAIKGVNGIGKTTLLKTLMQAIPAYEGTVEIDPNAKIGFFKQEDYSINKTTLQAFWDEYPSYTNYEVRAALAKCGLTTDHIESNVNVLSGGEQAKFRLALIMNRPCNILMLDEPTNHLDVEAKEELKRALKAYKQTVILVSHDPWFYEDIVDEIINLEQYTTKII
ncbi:MAG: ATP-binding cassette domain-containing protein [Erysipelotrichaceae bacterium]|nr:ATP-binding cassette domain-containing protein [Erysipelotrichaceae bacterium]MDY5252259.1 ABC-F family ATP-binding cassette domain-containing protein [Erysipelotrichaceae bacterium]